MWSKLSNLPVATPIMYQRETLRTLPYSTLLEVLYHLSRVYYAGVVVPVRSATHYSTVRTYMYVWVYHTPCPTLHVLYIQYSYQGAPLLELLSYPFSKYLKLVGGCRPRKSLLHKSRREISKKWGVTDNQTDKQKPARTSTHKLRERGTPIDGLHKSFGYFKPWQARCQICLPKIGDLQKLSARMWSWRFLQWWIEYVLHISVQGRNRIDRSRPVENSAPQSCQSEYFGINFNGHNYLHKLTKFKPVKQIHELVCAICNRQALTPWTIGRFYT